MQQALVQIVVKVINEKYINEKAFYQDKLGISPQSWDRWKKGEQGLKYENIQILSTLFTDYEWMLVQKVVRNSDMMPGMIDPVSEFFYLKYQIGKTWMQQGNARVEWDQTHENDQDSSRKSNMVILRVIADYYFWGYNDVIEFRLPGVIQQQIGHDAVKLLQWFNDESERIKDKE